MTQPFYDGLVLDHSYRYTPYAMASPSHSNRTSPYGYHGQHYHHHHDLRAEYGRRPPHHSMSHEPERNERNDRSRKRSALACSRCRRRKIKCSGDPEDGSGCDACRQSGTDPKDCYFFRVGSQSCDYIPTGSAGRPMHAAEPYVVDVQPIPEGYGLSSSYQPHFRSALPTLHTRGVIPTDYDAQCEASPIASYSYPASGLPRQDSFTSTYPLENYRSFSSTGAPMTTPVTSTYYEPTTSFGSFQHPAPIAFSQPPNGRLPSVTADSFSALNMGHLNSSLPAQTAQERRLPTPYTPHYLQTQYPAPEVPEIRPLASFTEPRVNVHGVHSRNALPWSQDSGASYGASYGASRSGSLAYLGLSGSRLPTPSTLQTTTAVSGPVLGYQFTGTSNNSPDVSPASGSSLAESFQSTSGSSTASMLPPSSNHYSTTTGNATTLRPLMLTQGPESSSAQQAAAASLYTFSHDRTSSDDSAHLTSSSPAYAQPPPLRQPQPQHVTSVDALHRQSLFEQQQQQRAETAHRMSLSNLNAHF